MPSQFWDLTPVEFHRYIRGFEWREERARWRTASIVAAIQNLMRRKGQRPVTAADLMGTARHDVPGARTPEAQLTALRRITRALGGDVRRG